MRRIRTGDSSALRELVAVQYEELHRIASRQLRTERPGHTLQATALVHEAFLKLSGEGSHDFADRAHFLAVASRVMRQVLVDYARARSAQKRNPLNMAVVENDSDGETESVNLLDLDIALTELEAEDASLARLVEMRYFGGMSGEDIAEALGQSINIVRYDLRLAHAWLRRRLQRGPDISR